MTIATIAPSGASSLSAFESKGLSQDADAVHLQMRDIVDHFFWNEAIGRPLGIALESLESMRDEASFDDWDGYGAAKISLFSYLEARRFLKSLPSTIPFPDVSLDPDGEVSFDWYADSDDIFSVSVGESGQLSYAGVFGINKVHGIEYFGRTLPRAILLNVQRLLGERNRGWF